MAVVDLRWPFGSRQRDSATAWMFETAAERPPRSKKEEDADEDEALDITPQGPPSPDDEADITALPTELEVLMAAGGFRNSIGWHQIQKRVRTIENGILMLQQQLADKTAALDTLTKESQAALASYAQMVFDGSAHADSLAQQLNEAHERNALLHSLLFQQQPQAAASQQPEQLVGEAMQPAEAAEGCSVAAYSGEAAKESCSDTCKPCAECCSGSDESATCAEPSAADSEAAIDTPARSTEGGASPAAAAAAAGCDGWSSAGDSEPVAAEPAEGGAVCVVVIGSKAEPGGGGDKKGARCPTRPNPLAAACKRAAAKLLPKARGGGDRSGRSIKAAVLRTLERVVSCGGCRVEV